MPRGSDFVARAAARPREAFLVLRASARRRPLGLLICVVACIGLLLAVRKREASPFALLPTTRFLFSSSTARFLQDTLAGAEFLAADCVACGLAAVSLWHLPVKHPAVRIALRASCLVAAAVAAVLIAHDTQQRVFLHPATRTIPMPTRTPRKICLDCLRRSRI